MSAGWIAWPRARALPAPLSASLSSSQVTLAPPPYSYYHYYYHQQHQPYHHPAYPAQQPQTHPQPHQHLSPVSVHTPDLAAAPAAATGGWFRAEKRWTGPGTEVNLRDPASKGLWGAPSVDELAKGTFQGSTEV
ncbi:hypothetical protein K435DRAFT_796541 [Dendrothele bispora CBS 962.96]|uniref:Uncharacterized protein n=1 Tax=Dendrothele bispora (strain CBS 962.96) TaxID=1314807 RepID=A0A4S8M5B6_DENBC|nr:hypothetical protein K435DRAFT_796541 [Dendrothele bispora CBS 962.96]